MGNSHADFLYITWQAGNRSTPNLLAHTRPMDARG